MRALEPPQRIDSSRAYRRHGQRLRLTCSRDELLSRLQIVGTGRLDALERADPLRHPVRRGDGERPPMLAATDMELSVRVAARRRDRGGWARRAAGPARCSTSCAACPPGQVSIALAEGGRARDDRGRRQRVQAAHVRRRRLSRAARDRPRAALHRRARGLPRGDRARRPRRVARRGPSRCSRASIVELGLGTLTVAATDSYRLAVRTTHARRAARPRTSRRSCRRARSASSSRIAQGSSATSVEIVVERNQMLFGVDDVWLSARVIEGQFPNFRALRPDAFEHEVVLPRAELAEVLVAHGAARPAQHRRCGCASSRASSRSRPRRQEVGEGRERLPCDFRGEPLEIGFNAGVPARRRRWRSAVTRCTSS